MKLIVATRKLAVFVALSLLLAGCQNATLSELTKRAKSVSAPIPEGEQKKQDIEVQEITISRAPSAPSNLVASRGTSPIQIVISWEDGDRPAILYHIERSGDGGDSWVQRGTATAGVQTYTDHLLASENSYLYRVRTKHQVEREILEKKLAQQILEERRIREEAERLAREEAEKRKQEAEKQAREEAERLAREEAEKLKQEAEKQAREEAERRRQEAEKQAKEETEKRKQEAKRQAILRAEKERKRTLKEKQKALISLLKRADKELTAGNLSAAEESLKQYREQRGEFTTGQKRYTKLLRQVETMGQILTDLEQTDDTERYLQKLLAEASALGKHGDQAGARKRYNEVISIDPANSEAKKGLQVLSKKPQKVVQKKSKKSKSDKKRKSSLLGKKAAGWIVQVATYTEEDKKTAYSMLGEIKKAGFKGVFIKKQELAGRTLYRLRLGAYGEKDEAMELRNQINSEMAERGVVSRVTLQKK